MLLRKKLADVGVASAVGTSCNRLVILEEKEIEHTYFPQIAR